MTRHTRRNDDSRKPVRSDGNNYASDELRPLLLTGARKRANDTSKLDPFVRQEISIHGRAGTTSCREIYEELVTSAGNRPIHVGTVELCACGPMGVPHVDDSDDDSHSEEANPPSEADAHAARDHHSSSPDDHLPDAVHEDDVGSDPESSESDFDEELLPTRHRVFREALQVISRVDKIEDLSLSNMSWRHLAPDVRAALCNPAYYNGLSSLRLYGVNFWSSSQFLQLLEIVTTLPVNTLTIAGCQWEVNNHHPDQVASRLPLKLQTLNVNEVRGWSMGSYRPLMDWLVAKRSECSIEVVDVVWSSLDFVPMVNLLRRVAPCMLRCVLILVTFEYWHRDKTDENIGRLRDEENKDVDDIVITHSLPDDIVDHMTWSSDCARRRLLEQLPTMDEACEVSGELLREHPIQGCIAEDIEVRFDWTPLAVNGFEVLRQMISPNLKSLVIRLHIRQLGELDEARLNALFGGIDAALRPVHETVKYEVELHVAPPYCHEGDDSEHQHRGAPRVVHVHPGEDFKGPPHLPLLYQGGAKPRVHVFWNNYTVLMENEQ